MPRDRSPQLYVKIRNSLVDTPDVWVSGLYVMPGAPAASFLVVQRTGEFVDALLCVYSHLGYFPCEFFKHERLIWPFESDSVFHYSLVDESNLEFDRKISIKSFANKDDLATLADSSAREIADVFCPHFPQLVPFSEANPSLELDEVLEDGETEFRKKFPGLLTQETPNFWGHKR